MFDDLKDLFSDAEQALKIFAGAAGTAFLVISVVLLVLYGLRG